jgi:hypothetical protein
MLVSLMLSAAIQIAAQPVAQPGATAPADTRRDGGLLYWQNPPTCDQRPRTVVGPPPAAERLIPTAQDSVVVPMRPGRPRIQLRPGISSNLLWTPSEFPDAGVYLPVVRMVEGCMIPVPVSDRKIPDVQSPRR